MTAIRTAARLLLVGALGLALGAPWGFLQTVAWAGMVIRYSQTDGFATALSKTFDGKHPCRMCLQIRDSRQQEKRQQKDAPLTQLAKISDLVLGDRQTVSSVAPVAARDAVPIQPRLRPDFIESPPKPPPRGFLVVL